MTDTINFLFQYDKVHKLTSDAKFGKSNTSFVSVVISKTKCTYKTDTLNGRCSKVLFCELSTVWSTICPAVIAFND